jgi:hypothetical protein
MYSKIITSNSKKTGCEKTMVKTNYLPKRLIHFLTGTKKAAERNSAAFLLLH